MQCQGVVFSADNAYILTSSANTLRITANAHSKKVMIRLFASNHHRVSGVFSSEAWKALVELINQVRMSESPDEGSLNNLINSEGNNFLHTSVIRGDAVTVRKCLELAKSSSMLDINSVNVAGFSALRMAIELVNSASTINVTLNIGSSNSADIFKIEDPVGIAISIFAALLDAGAEYLLFLVLYFTL